MNAKNELADLMKKKDELERLIAIQARLTVVNPIFENAQIWEAGFVRADGQVYGILLQMPGFDEIERLMKDLPVSPAGLFKSKQRYAPSFFPQWHKNERYEDEPKTRCDYKYNFCVQDDRIVMEGIKFYAVVDGIYLDIKVSLPWGTRLTRWYAKTEKREGQKVTCIYDNRSLYGGCFLTKKLWSNSVDFDFYYSLGEKPGE